MARGSWSRADTAVAVMAAIAAMFIIFTNPAFSPFVPQESVHVQPSLVLAGSSGNGALTVSIVNVGKVPVTGAEIVGFGGVNLTRPYSVDILGGQLGYGGSITFPLVVSSAANATAPPVNGIYYPGALSAGHSYELEVRVVFANGDSKVFTAPVNASAAPDPAARAPP